MTSTLLTRLQASDAPNLTLFEEALERFGETLNGGIAAQAVVDCLPGVFATLVEELQNGKVMSVSGVVELARPFLEASLPAKIPEWAEWSAQRFAGDALMVICHIDKEAPSLVNIVLNYAKHVVHEQGKASGALNAKDLMGICKALRPEAFAGSAND